MADDEGLLTTAEAASLARRKPGTIYNHARKGLLPGTKDPISGHWRFKREDVLRTYGLEDQSELAVDAAALIHREVGRLRGRRGA